MSLGKGICFSKHYKKMDGKVSAEFFKYKLREILKKSLIRLKVF